MQQGKTKVADDKVGSSQASIGSVASGLAPTQLFRQPQSSSSSTHPSGGVGPQVKLFQWIQAAQNPAASDHQQGKSNLLFILESLEQHFQVRSEESVKLALPIAKVFPIEVLACIANALGKSALKTDPWLYMGLSGVLQTTLVDSSMLSKVGNKPIESLLHFVIRLFNNEILLTSGDQRVSYLALDTINLSLMCLKELGVNKLPEVVKKEIESILAEIEPHSNDVLDVVKMQRLYAKNILLTIEADLGFYAKLKPYLGPAAKLGGGIGLIGVAVGIAAGTEGEAIAPAAKLGWAGLKLSLEGGFGLYQAIPKSASSWYHYTLTTMVLLTLVMEISTEKEKDLGLLLDRLVSKELNHHGIGLIGVMYRLSQLYVSPEATEAMKNKLIETFASIASMPSQRFSLTASSAYEGAVRKNALMTLRHLSDLDYTTSAASEAELDANDRMKELAGERYKTCLKPLRGQRHLQGAIREQYPSFQQLIRFFVDLDAEVLQAKFGLLQALITKVEKRGSISDAGREINVRTARAEAAETIAYRALSEIDYQPERTTELLSLIDKMQAGDTLFLDSAVAGVSRTAAAVASPGATVPSWVATPTRAAEEGQPSEVKQPQVGQSSLPPGGNSSPKM